MQPRLRRPGDWHAANWEGAAWPVFQTVRRRPDDPKRSGLEVRTFSEKLSAEANADTVVSCPISIVQHPNAATFGALRKNILNSDAAASRLCCFHHGFPDYREFYWIILLAVFAFAFGPHS